MIHEVAKNQTKLSDLSELNIHQAIIILESVFFKPNSMGLKLFSKYLNLKVSRDDEIKYPAPKQKISIILHSAEKNQGNEVNLSHVVRRQEQQQINNLTS